MTSVASVATVVATAVSAQDHREILGLDTFTAEDGAAWTRFLKGLAARGLSRVRLVISDDHQELTGALAAVVREAPPGRGAARTSCAISYVWCPDRPSPSRPPWSGASSLEPSAAEVQA